MQQYLLSMMNPLRLHVSPVHVDYRYSEKHVLKAIQRAANGDHQPTFSKVVTCDRVEYAIDFKLFRNTHLALSAEIYGATVVVEYTTIHMYVEAPERYVVRFLLAADALPTDAVFKTNQTMNFDKSVFTEKIVAAPQELWFLFLKVPAPYATVAHMVKLIFPESPNPPGAAQGIYLYANYSAVSGDM